jgi:hypothetical protein
MNTRKHFPNLATVIIGALLLCSTAHASIGACKCTSNAHYSRVEFNLDRFTTSKEAAIFELSHHGLIIHDATDNKFYVIWADGLVAPNEQYQCAHMEDA